MNGRNGICEFKSLAKSVELDTEWFRSVTSALPKFATQGGGSIVSFVNPYSDNPGEDAPISDSGYLGCRVFFKLDQLRLRTYRISANSFRRNYSFLKLFGHST